VLRGTRGFRKDRIISSWRRLHSEKLYNSYRSPNIATVNISRRLRRTGHVARMTGVIMHTTSLDVKHADEL
jgi:hypothetical protein